jgi:hypothetical protein
MSPCSVWQGLWAAAQQRRCLYVLYTKEGTIVPLSKYRGFGVYSMDKTGGRWKMFITRTNAASWLSSGSSPSQSLLKPFKVKLLNDYGLVTWHRINHLVCFELEFFSWLDWRRSVGGSCFILSYLLLQIPANQLFFLCSVIIDYTIENVK